MNQKPKIKCPMEFGRYSLLSELGSGAMGAVFLARDNQLGRDVAIKTPRIDADDKELLERFKKEAQIAANINHPHICPIFDVGIQSDIPFITMAYIEGQTLEKYLASGKTLNFRQTVTLIRKISLAIQEAHRKGIIHRDLKPANILINKAGEPVVMDFGLAKKTARVGQNVLSEEDVSGTPAYMAPEQFNQNSFIREELCDQYSIGIVLYQLICGKVPFEAESLVDLILKIKNENPKRPSFVNPVVDDKIENICLKAINKNPDLRYLNLKEFIIDLNEYLKGDPSAQVARPSSELSRQTAGEIRVSRMLGGRSMEIASRILADARDQVPVLPIKKKRKKKKNFQLRSLLSLVSLVFLSFLALIVFYKNRSYIGFGSSDSRFSIGSNKNNGVSGVDLIKTSRAYISFKIPRAHDNAISCISKSRNENIFITTSDDKKIIIWDFKTKSKKFILAGHQDKIRQARFTPDGSKIVSCCRDKTIKVWDSVSGLEIKTINGHTDWVESVICTPDGKKIISGSKDRTIRMWDLESGIEIKNIAIDDEHIRNLIISKDGSRLFICGSNMNSPFRIIDVNKWDFAHDPEIQCHDTFLFNSTMTNDEKILGAVEYYYPGYRKGICFWEMETGRILHQFQHPSKRQHCIDFLEDKDLFITGGDDRNVNIWKFSTVELLYSLEGHQDLINTMLFFKDDNFIISGSGDGELIFWEKERK